MQFFRIKSSQNNHSSPRLKKEVIIAASLIVLPLLYPTVAFGSMFSFVSDIVGDKVSAKTPEVKDTPNSQTMALLKAVNNSDPVQTGDIHPVLASQNALVAEIGPAGTAFDIDEQTSTEISIYTVRADDTLSEVAKMFNVSVNTIVWANNLTRTSALKEGQTLVILPITGIRYTAKKGDSIKKIVTKYKANLDDVLMYNDLSLNSVISEGDTIIIPDAEPSAVIKTPAPAPIKSAPLGYYMRPISGGHKSQGIHGHNGVDLAAPVGTPIYASASGVVIASIVNDGWNGGYGNYVVISHANGTQTLYAHNLTNFVSVGQSVRKGDVIAKIGMTGKTTGPHVHFEIRGARNPF